MTTAIRRAVLLLAVGTVLPLTACGSSSALPAAEAVGHYDEAATQISAALAAGDTSWELAEDTRRAEEVRGVCEYTPGSWRPAGDLPVVEDETVWQERIDAVNPVLEQHGFTPVEEVTKDGSREVLESSDDHGATLRVTAEGELRIWGATVDADPCALEELQSN